MGEPQQLEQVLARIQPIQRPTHWQPNTPTSTEGICPKCGNRWSERYYDGASPFAKARRCDCEGAQAYWTERDREREERRLEMVRMQEEAERERAERAAKCQHCGGDGYTHPDDPRMCTCQYGPVWNRGMAGTFGIDVDAIPARFADARLSQFNERIVEQCKAINLRDGQGAMIHGTVGTGKTHLAVALTWEALDYCQYDRILFLPVPELLHEIRRGFDKDTDADRGILKRAMDASLVVLDDVGAERVTDWVKETQYMLINHRYNHRLVTICTTNLAPSKLAAHIGDRAASRLMEMCTVVKLTGSDRRLAR